MNGLDNIPTELGMSEPWADRHGSLWLEPPALDVRAMAYVMTSHGARFITITAQELPESAGLRMDYHWDLDGRLLTFVTAPHENRIDSIFDLCEAADWIEREIHEYYKTDFTGREYEPLLLRAGDDCGVNLRKEDE